MRVITSTPASKGTTRVKMPRSRNSMLSLLNETDPSIVMREAPNQVRLEELLLQVLSELKDLRGELRARPQALPSDLFELSIYDVC